MDQILTQQLRYIVWVVLSLQHQWKLASEVPLEVVYLNKPLRVEPHLPVATGVVERELPIQYIAIVELYADKAQKPNKIKIIKQFTF